MIDSLDGRLKQSTPAGQRVGTLHLQVRRRITASREGGEQPGPRSLTYHPIKSRINFSDGEVATSLQALPTNGIMFILRRLMDGQMAPRFHQSVLATGERRYINGHALCCPCARSKHAKRRCRKILLTHAYKPPKIGRSWCKRVHICPVVEVGTASNKQNGWWDRSCRCIAKGS